VKAALTQAHLNSCDDKYGEEDAAAYQDALYALDAALNRWTKASNDFLAAAGADRPGNANRRLYR